ncbi:MGDG synthase family glycosyltransferase [Pontiella sulfatireligans]|uniref:Processive diacylglycerol beta-glucosyltransferase n=1 Tax=Pontiella sulfatireligans TaxID=2750658 RepID=A0A6C2UUL7_9BACT|nr:glycosyltransferase [Pontiella sulfatireligans]VGO22576.1 Processive diacylglycerol beta-glucosyltransferase [Pontiella sulfatireligans]
MILYANAGNGHRRAAEALAAVCEKDERISEYKLVDALDYTNKVFQELYANLYIEAVKKAPLLWSMAFDDSDQPWVREKGRMLMHRLHSHPLAKEIKKFQPDLCLCTHFMPSDIISTMLREDDIQTDLGVVVTDYYVHASWLESFVNRVYVAKEESREQLVRLKFPPKRVKTLGIPIDPMFGNLGDRNELCAKHGIDPALPMVLLSAGAFGVMSGDDMAQMLSGISSPCHLAVVCGNNKKLKEQIEKYIAGNPAENITYHILGFTKEMHEWMAMASLFIGKPGGLSTSECLACGLPMVIWNPIPGQEVFNSIYLLENGAAISPDSVSTLSFRIDQLLKNPEKLKRMQESAKALSRPDAARAIVDDAIEHLGEGVVRIPTGKKGLRDRLRERL